VNEIAHENIVDVFSFGQLPDGRHFFVMDLLRGTTLEQLLAKRGRLSPDEALPILTGVGLALDAAHARKIAHRDIKPANIAAVPPERARRRGFFTDVMARRPRSRSPAGEAVSESRVRVPVAVLARVENPVPANSGHDGRKIRAAAQRDAEDDQPGKVRQEPENTGAHSSAQARPLMTRASPRRDPQAGRISCGRSRDRTCDFDRVKMIRAVSARFGPLQMLEEAMIRAVTTKWDSGWYSEGGVPLGVSLSGVRRSWVRGSNQPERAVGCRFTRPSA